MAGSEAGSSSDGPVLNLMNKRLRALKKKLNRIHQMEETMAQGKILNKEQEEVLRSKPSLLTLIDEYEKLRQPLSLALQEELNQQPSKPQPLTSPPPETIVEDVVKLVYFGKLFDVKQQSDFTSTMLTRSHERACCLTYDYVTDDSTDLLSEKDLDMISLLSGFVISRPGHSGLSHKNALSRCLEHAKLWIANADQPIEDGVDVTYAGLRERLNKIMASDYLTTTPEMKPAVEMVQNASVTEFVTVQTESEISYEPKQDDIANFEGQEVGVDQSNPDEESPKDGSETSNPGLAISIQQYQQKSEADAEEQSLRDESKEKQYIPRRAYQNLRGSSRGGGGGRRGYSNGRGGRGSRGGGYQNGRNQYDQSGNFYPRNYYNARGRGGRGSGGNTYSNHGSVAQGNHVHDE